MDKLQMFFRLTKVDPIKGIVQGIAVQEVPDKSGEIFDYATSKAHFEEWSGAISKATDGQNLGNVREMHGKNAVGKLTDIDYDDEQRLIRVTATIVDPAAKLKLAESIYTGFSIGGRYGKKWQDPDNKDLTRYTAVPAELSLVDNPCIPGATFTMVKADGAEVQVPFKIVAPDPLSDDARLELARSVSAGLDDAALVNTISVYSEHPLIKALGAQGSRDDAEEALFRIAARDDAEPGEGTAKYGNVTFADEKNKKYPIDTEAHIRAAWNYINKPKNAAKYDSGDVGTIKSKIVAAWKKHIDKAGPPSAKADKAAPAPVQKDIPANLTTLAELSGGESILPAKAAALIAGMGQDDRDKLAAAGFEGIDVSAIVDEAGMAKFLGTATNMARLRAAVKKALGKTDNVPAPAHGLKKSMSQVCQMASAIDNLCMLRDSIAYEASREMDGTALVAQIETLIGTACELLRDLADEETEEIEEGREYFSMAAHVGSLRKIIAGQLPTARKGFVMTALPETTAGLLTKLLEKYGARHSKVDQAHLQDAHDHLSAMGAVCTTGEDEEEDGEKGAGGDLKKILGVTKAALEKVTNQRDALQLRLDGIPRPSKASLAFTLVSKGVDAPAEEDLGKAVAAEVEKILALPEDKRAVAINSLRIRAQAGNYLPQP